MGTANISYGYCHCGCGQRTNLTPHTDKNKGWVKGEPLRFIHNHHCVGSNHFGWENGIKQKSPYVMLRTGVGKYEYEHRLIAERLLGKPLPLGAEVHHYNGHDPSNKYEIVICENKSYHRFLDARGRALAESGHADWRKCKYCHQYDDPKNLQFTGGSGSAYHNVCNAEYAAKWRANRN